MAAVGPGEHTLVTADGVRLSAWHRPGSTDLAFVIAHGFSGSWREARVQRVAGVLALSGGVIALDQRGHGASAGASTLGYREVHDVDAAVSWAREAGYARIVTVGFSMGAAVVVRHAALHRGVDAVVAVSGPAFWYYRGTAVMRRLHLAVESPLGRWGIQRCMGTRVLGEHWPTPSPMPPVDAAALLAPTPLLIVHGTQDRYFPLEHATSLHRAASSTSPDLVDLWIIDGMGHAESAMTPQLVERMSAWARDRVGGDRS